MKAFEFILIIFAIVFSVIILYKSFNDLFKDDENNLEFDDHIMYPNNDREEDNT